MSLPRSEDEHAITRLMNIYNYATDSQDFVRLASCFTEDGRLHGAFGSWVMHQQIHEFAAFARDPAATAGPVRHFISNPIIDVDGDTARAVTSSLVTRVPVGGEPRILLTGEYHDELVRVDGEWLFKVRRVVVDGR